MRNAANMYALTAGSFKHSVGTYYVSSREAQDTLWSEPLEETHPAVLAFKSRAYEGHPHPHVLNFADCFDNWATAWSNKTCPHESRGSKKQACVAYGICLSSSTPPSHSISSLAGSADHILS